MIVIVIVMWLRISRHKKPRKEDDYMKGNFLLLLSSVEVIKKKKKKKDMEGNSNYDYLWKRWERIRFRFRCFESFMKGSTFPFLKVRIDSRCGYRNHHRYSNNHTQRDILDFRIENPATVVSSIYQLILKEEWDKTVCRFIKRLSQCV